MVTFIEYSALQLFFLVAGPERPPSGLTRALPSECRGLNNFSTTLAVRYDEHRIMGPKPCSNCKGPSMKPSGCLLNGSAFKVPFKGSSGMQQVEGRGVLLP